LHERRFKTTHMRFTPNCALTRRALQARSRSPYPPRPPRRTARAAQLSRRPSRARPPPRRSAGRTAAAPRAAPVRAIHPCQHSGAFFPQSALPHEPLSPSRSALQGRAPAGRPPRRARWGRPAARPRSARPAARAAAPAGTPPGTRPRARPACARAPCAGRAVSRAAGVPPKRAADYSVQIAPCAPSSHRRRTAACQGTARARLPPGPAALPAGASTPDGARCKPRTGALTRGMRGGRRQAQAPQRPRQCCPARLPPRRGRWYDFLVSRLTLSVLRPDVPHQPAAP